MPSSLCSSLYFRHHAFVTMFCPCTFVIMPSSLCFVTIVSSSNECSDENRGEAGSAKRVMTPTEVIASAVTRIEVKLGVQREQ